MGLVPKRRAAAAESEKAGRTNAAAAAATDRRIDHLVYDLYGLTEEEIKLVGAAK